MPSARTSATAALGPMGAFEMYGIAYVASTRVVAAASPGTLTPTLEVRDDRLFAQCGGGGTLDVLALEIDGAPATAAALTTRFGRAPALLGGGRR